jgi:hypothetical protein
MAREYLPKTPFFLIADFLPIFFVFKKHFASQHDKPAKAYRIHSRFIMVLFLLAGLSGWLIFAGDG